MSGPALESFLARLYVDPEVRDRFLADPPAEVARWRLPEDEARAALAIDRTGLELFAVSLGRKRRAREPSARSSGLAARLSGLAQRCSRGLAAMFG